jgi:hypothetical protein
MMVVTHGLSGYVVSRVAMPLLRRHSPLPPGAMSLGFFLGAMSPDVDIVTRVLLGYSAYFSGAWYGHRQASHSIVGTCVLAALIALIGFAPWIRRAVRELPPARRLRATVRGTLWAWGCVWCGGMLHLVGDLPTPGMSLAVLWPLPYRFGSWITPYLWWMFVSAVLLAAGLRWMGQRIVAAGAVRTGIYVAGAAWAVYAATLYRWLQYLAVSRYETASQYAAIQRELLPAWLAAFSSESVRSVWRWMVY